MRFILISLFFALQLNAYEIEDKIKAAVISKIVKYVDLQKNDDKYFKITILKNPFGDLFNTMYSGRLINAKPVKIIYINEIYQLEDTDVLYIPTLNSESLEKILASEKTKNVLTISDNRGFAQRGGVVQLYFVSQKIKIKINTASAYANNIYVKPALLRIAELVKGERE